VNTAQCASGHTPAAPGCRCGFYAYGTRRAARQYAEARRVLAVVACWGRVVPGTRGLRAQYARIEAIWLSARVSPHLARQLRERYPSVTVYRSKRVMLRRHPPTRLDSYVLRPRQERQRAVQRRRERQRAFQLRQERQQALQLRRERQQGSFIIRRSGCSCCWCGAIGGSPARSCWRWAWRWPSMRCCSRRPRCGPAPFSEALRSSCQVWHYEPGIRRPKRAKGRTVGNIGKEAEEIEVLPAEQTVPAERESGPAEPAPPEPAPVPAAEPTPARA